MLGDIDLSGDKPNPRKRENVKRSSGAKPKRMLQCLSHKQDMGNRNESHMKWGF